MTFLRFRVELVDKEKADGVGAGEAALKPSGHVECGGAALKSGSEVVAAWRMEEGGELGEVRFVDGATKHRWWGVRVPAELWVARSEDPRVPV